MQSHKCFHRLWTNSMTLTIFLRITTMNSHNLTLSIKNRRAFMAPICPARMFKRTQLFMYISINFIWQISFENSIRNRKWLMSKQLFSIIFVSFKINRISNTKNFRCVLVISECRDCHRRINLLENWINMDDFQNCNS